MTSIEYLAEAVKDLNQDEQLSLHYRLVGAASVHIPPKLWREIVDGQISSVRAATARRPFLVPAKQPDGAA